jgi:hypothetical protein
MQAFDASSMIHAWDNYPVDQFPPLWNWIASQIEAAVFVMPKVAYEEVERKYPECATWLNDHDLQRVEVSNEILQEAMRVKGLLGIQDDKYYARGVGENDILIIATSSISHFELVSDEGRQIQAPQIKANMKIPAVCGLKDVAVPCVNFIELIRRSRVVFQ